MLSTINKRYLLFTVLLLPMFLIRVVNEFMLIYIINFITSFVFFLVINNCQNVKEENYFTANRLAIQLFIYSLIAVSIYNAISFYYRGNFFVFSEADAYYYDLHSQRMASMDFWDSINNYLDYNAIEDLGAVLLMSTLYRIIESALFVNFFYIITGIITALGIFRISIIFMSKKYAYLCALTYSISSYVLWFHSSSLKESFMVMLIVLFFDQFYQYSHQRKIKHLIISFIIIFVFTLFRPAIIFIGIGSVGLGVILSRKITPSTLMFLVVILFIVFYMSSTLMEQSDRFLYSDTDKMIELKESGGLVKGGVLFTYFVNIVAATIGPLPTILPNVKTMLSLFSPGLIYRVLLGSTLWFGIFYMIKTRENGLYPLVLFYLIEAGSLVYILEALELRKSLLHFPMIYIISFWFLNKCNSCSFVTTETKNRIIFLTNISIIVFFAVIIYWNLRF